MLSSRSFEIRTIPGAALEVREARDSQKIDCHRHGELARQRRQKKYRSLQHAHQLQLAARIVCRDLRGHLPNPAMDLLFGEEDALDGRHGHRARRSGSRYFITRSCTSF